MNESVLRLAMFISGGGTTMRAIIQATKAGGCLEGKVRPTILIASKECGGIEKAKAEGIHQGYIYIMPPKNFSSREEWGDAVVLMCRAHCIDIIGFYGWLPLIPESLVVEYENRSVSQHPGPLDPGYYAEDGTQLDFGGKGMHGRRVHCARLLFVRETRHDLWSEATAQRVGKLYDNGALLKTERIEITPDDDVISLQEKVLPVEHKVQIATLLDFSNGTVQEIHRTDHFVQENEAALLRHTKVISGLLFPHG